MGFQCRVETITFNAEKKTWTNVQQLEGCDKPFQRALCQLVDRENLEEAFHAELDQCG